MEGWICPRCQTVHAPHIPQCDCLPPSITSTTPVIRLTGVCTCGTTAICPLHAPKTYYLTTTIAYETGYTSPFTN